MREGYIGLDKAKPDSKINVDDDIGPVIMNERRDYELVVSWLGAARFVLVKPQPGLLAPHSYHGK
jgi:hypothetical protein